jgi:7-carboxy-7-deazaguanine synthase
MMNRKSNNTDQFNLTDGQIFVNETFFSLQGEGYFTGRFAYFIRFAGCDIGCTWCDTKDAWSTENSRKFLIKEIVEEANTKSIDYVVITGGEPLIYNLVELTSELKKSNKFIHIETSGAYPLWAQFDWLSLSPKKIKLPLKEYYAQANELKVVIENNKDLEFALEQSKLTNPKSILYLQPQWSNVSTLLPEILNFIEQNPEWRLSLQTHKYLGIP